MAQFTLGGVRQWGGVINHSPQLSIHLAFVWCFGGQVKIRDVEIGQDAEEPELVASTEDDVILKSLQAWAKTTMEVLGS